MRRTSIIRELRDMPIRKRMACRSGILLSAILPSRAKEVQHGRLTNSTLLVDRILRNGLRARALRSRDHETLANMLRAYWAADARKFGSAYEFRFRDNFLQHDKFLFELAEELIDRRSIDRICEIGCGNGSVLNYLSDRLTAVSEFVGLDLDPSQMAENDRRYQKPGLNFVASPAIDWLEQNVRKTDLIIANGGVLEYFLRSELNELLDIASRERVAGFVLIESIASNHDMDDDTMTYVYGHEFSFSHNYPYLLSRHGYRIVHQSDRTGTAGARWLRLVVEFNDGQASREQC